MQRGEEQENQQQQHQLVQLYCVLPDVCLWPCCVVCKLFLFHSRPTSFSREWKQKPNFNRRDEIYVFGISNIFIAHRFCFPEWNTRKPVRVRLWSRKSRTTRAMQSIYFPEKKASQAQRVVCGMEMTSTCDSGICGQSQQASEPQKVNVSRT